MKKIKKSILNEYVPGENGYVYTGDSYYPSDCTLWKRTRLYSLIFLALCAVFCVGGSLIPSDAFRNCFYVLIPFVAEIVLLAVTAYHMLSFVFRTHPIPGYILKKYNSPFLPLCIALCAVSVARMAATAVFFILNGFESKVFSVGILLCNTAAAIFALIPGIIMRKVIWKAAPRESLSSVPKEDT